MATIFRHARVACARRGERDPEISDERLPVVQQYILGLDVAVDHAMAVGVIERTGDLFRYTQRHVDRQLLLTLEKVAQRFSLHVRHYIERRAVEFTRVVQRQDVRVLQVGGGLDLLEETLGTDDSRKLRTQYLERDLAAVPDVFGEVDRRHAAGAEVALDRVAACEGGGQLRGGIH